MNRHQAFGLLLVAATALVVRGGFTTESAFFGAPNRAPVTPSHYDNLLALIGLAPAAHEPEAAVPEEEIGETEILPEEVAEPPPPAPEKPKEKVKARGSNPAPPPAPNSAPAVPAEAEPTIERSAVEALITRQSGKLYECYWYFAADNGRNSGTAKVRLTIQPTTGLVSAVEVLEDPFRNDRFSECLVVKLRGQRVSPPPTGEVLVRYPLIFSAEGAQP